MGHRRNDGKRVRIDKAVVPGVWSFSRRKASDRCEQSTASLFHGGDAAARARRSLRSRGSTSSLPPGWTLLADRPVPVYVHGDGIANQSAGRGHDQRPQMGASKTLFPDGCTHVIEVDGVAGRFPRNWNRASVSGTIAFHVVAADSLAEGVAAGLRRRGSAVVLVRFAPFVLRVTGLSVERIRLASRLRLWQNFSERRGIREGGNPPRPAFLSLPRTRMDNIIAAQELQIERKALSTSNSARTTVAAFSASRRKRMGAATRSSCPAPGWMISARRSTRCLTPSPPHPRPRRRRPEQSAA